MAVLFPGLRAWKTSVLRIVAGTTRRLWLRFRLRNAGVEKDLTLRVDGLTTADRAFKKEPALRKRQIAARWSWSESPARWLIYPGGTGELPLPKTVERDDAGAFARRRSIYWPPAYVYRFANALYHGERGAVVDDQRRVLSDLADADLRSFTGDLSALFHPKTEPHFYGGKAVVVSSSRNHYHWLLKMLPRLHLVREAGVEVDKCEALLINQPIAAQSEGYAAAGLDQGGLRVVKSGQFWWCRELYVANIAHNPPSWAVNYLRRTFSSALPASESRTAVYLKRGNAARRRVANEDEVSAHLSARGVHALDLSGLSFREQIQAIAGADLIVAPHGAALANLVFAKDRARVLEIFASSENQKCYWILAHHRQAIYHYMLGEPIPRGAEPNRFDITIPIEKLDRAVDFLLHDPDEPPEAPAR